MYRILALICLTVLLSTTEANAQFRPGSVGFDLKSFEPYKQNKVKTQSTFKLDEDSIQTLVSVSDYWDNGWLLRIAYPPEELGYDEEFADTMKDEFTYFPDGRLRIKTLYGYDLYPIELHFSYGKKKKLVKSNVLAAESREYTYEYGKNKKIEIKKGQTGQYEMDADGNFLDKMIMVDIDASKYTWNNKGLLTEEKFYMFDSFYNLIQYDYNDNGQLIKMVVYYDEASDAIPVSTTKFYYHENGLLKNSVSISDEMETRYFYEYTYFE
jgi:hypothetical protein